jgi:metal-sulfur cluster biosynthetic enzyme
MMINFSKKDEVEGKDSVVSNQSDQEIVFIARQALSEIVDPELGIDIISLGLVYDVRIESTKIASSDNGSESEIKTLVVDMTLTTPGCPVSESLPVQASEYLSQIFSSQCPVRVNLVWDPPWTPEKMDFTIARAMGLL